MTAREQLAKLICSDVTLTINDLEKRYPQRELKEDTINLINNECNKFEDEFYNIKDENLSILEELKAKYEL